MFKNKGNHNAAIKELKNDNNNAVAFVYDNFEKSKGSMSDVVVTLKDNLATKDATTQASSRILEGFKPGYDATVVEKLREAGADVVAKTHLDELALGGTGLLSGFGSVMNPLDKNRITGGSSSGAVATFTESISVALGSDTGDSVRLPSSFTGNVGFKPSYGAVSRYGLFAFASSLDTVGWVTHNVNDSILTAQVLFGRDDKDMTSKEVELPVVETIKPKKVAVLNMYELNSPEAEKRIKDLSDKMKSDGVEVETVSVERPLLDAIAEAYGIISYSEVTSNDSNLNGISFGNRNGGKGWEEIMTEARSANFGWMVQRRLTLGALFLKAENQEEIFNKAKKVRRLIVNAFNDIQSKYDVLIYPATEIAPNVNQPKSDTFISALLSSANFSGNPSISIPFGKKDGMPFGLAIEGTRYEDKKMLSNALYIEELIGGKYE